MPASYTSAILPHSPHISQDWEATSVLETVWKEMEKSLILWKKIKMTYHFSEKSRIFIELTIICFYEPCLAKGINFL